jgi:uncharacterized repeat protein (TIGR01451 family)
MEAPKLSTKPFAKHFRLLVVAAMVVALLVVAPAAQAAAPATTLSKSAGPNPATKGQPLTFTISETNNTQNQVTVSVIDDLAANLDFNDLSFIGDLGFGSGCTSPPSTGGGRVSCALKLDSGKSGGVTLQVIPTTAGSTKNTAIDDQGNMSSVVVCIKDSNGAGCTSPPHKKHHKKHHRHHH